MVISKELIKQSTRNILTIHLYFSLPSSLSAVGFMKDIPSHYARTTVFSALSDNKLSVQFHPLPQSFSYTTGSNVQSSWQESVQSKRNQSSPITNITESLFRSW